MLSWCRASAWALGISPSPRVRRFNWHVLLTYYLLTYYLDTYYLLRSCQLVPFRGPENKPEKNGYVRPQAPAHRRFTHSAPPGATDDTRYSTARAARPPAASARTTLLTANISTAIQAAEVRICPNHPQRRERAHVSVSRRGSCVRCVLSGQFAVRIHIHSFPFTCGTKSVPCTRSSGLFGSRILCSG